MRRSIFLAVFLAAAAGGGSGWATVAGAADSIVRQASGQLFAGETARAIALARMHLDPDSADAALRSVLVQAYAQRDRICVPPAAPAPGTFVETAAGRGHCATIFLPQATQDSIAAVIAAEKSLAPNDVGGYLIAVDHELDNGTPAGLEAALDSLDHFDPQTVDPRVNERFAMTRRPAQLGVLARHVRGRDPRSSDCRRNEQILNALAVDGDCAQVLALLDSLPADTPCASRLEFVAASALAAGARYRELWELTKRAPPATSGSDYYGYVLISALAAAHFDREQSRERLEYERINEESYPEPARTILADLRRLLAAPAAPAGEWAALAEDPFLAGVNFKDVRVLLRSLALRQDPRLVPAARAQIEDFAARNMPGAAARVCSDFAGGVTPDLDRRWDPRRPQYLRKAAAYYFLAEDYAACLAAVAAIDHPDPTGELLAGAAALRTGDPAAARARLERVLAADPALRDTAAGLLALAAEAERSRP